MVLARNFWVDIEDASGNLVGAGPISVPFFDRGNPLSKAAEFSFPISPADPNLSAVQQKLFVICRYLDSSGAVQIFGGGIIDSIDKSYTFSRTNYIVSGPTLMGELNYRSVRELQIGDDTGGDNDAPDQIMAFAPSGWTILNGTTVDDIYVRFDGQSVLNSLVNISDATGEHFRLGTGRQIVWIGPYSGFASSGVRAVGGVPIGKSAAGVPEIMIIEQLRELTDSHDLVTRIYPRGAGNGNAVLRLLALTESPPAGFVANISQGYIENTAAVALYGVIEKEIDFKNLSPISNSAAAKEQASNQLMRAGVQYLRRWLAPQQFYELILKKSEVILQPGTTILVVFKQTINGVDIFDIDQVFNIVDVTDRLSEGGRYTQSIKVSTTDTLPMSDEELIISGIESAKAVSTHAQMNANARWLRTTGSMDDANDLAVPFWLGPETVNINTCLLRFQINPLRSTAKAAASGGGSTSGSGGSTAPTSANNNQTHTHAIDNRGSAITHNMGVDSLGNITIPSFGGDPGISLPASVNHTHTVTIGNHDHTTPNHTHSLTYGIFEETAGNTLAIGDLTITINGGSLTNSPASIGSGWYEVDITVDIVDSILSPDQESNVVLYSTAVAKTASIITDISLVDVVQAVSII